MDELTPDRAVKSLPLLRAVVSEKVELNEKDFGLCPFHNESTPSFNIFLATSGRARYHCFGCGADGDVFNYLQNVNGLKFRRALVKISNMTGKELLPLSEKSELASTRDDNYCFSTCQNYANLREDYHILLEENQLLRSRLGLPPFMPGEKLT